jgi:hypothetical protein
VCSQGLSSCLDCTASTVAPAEGSGHCDSCPAHSTASFAKACLCDENWYAKKLKKDEGEDPNNGNGNGNGNAADFECLPCPSVSAVDFRLTMG